MQYFDHSTTAGGDDKIIALRLEHGGAAVDAYWVILEQIYRDETPLVFFGNRHANLSLSHRLGTDESTLETWVSAMLDIGLLGTDENDPNALVSERAMDNIRAYQEKCETARQNGKKGGRKPTQKPNPNQSAKRALSEGQANKTKQNKGIGSHKGNQIPAATGGAVSAAPPPQGKPTCPECGSKAWRNPQAGCYDCDECRGSFTASEVVWA